MGIALITKDYENTVGKQRMPVIVEFYASWCPKCGMMYPVVERIASRYQGKWIFYKIDIDISKEIAEYIGIEIVPTFVVYRDGKSVDIQPEFFQKKLWKNESGKC